MCDAVIVTDVNGLVLRLNPVAEQLTGWSCGEAVGRALAEVVRVVRSPSRLPEAQPIQETIREGAAIGLSNRTVLLHRRSGEFPVAETCSALRDASGGICGALVVLRNLSREQQTENMVNSLNHELEERVRRTTGELQELQRRHAALLNHIRGMAYRCSCDGGWTMEYVSDGAAGLLGVDPAALTSGTVSYGNLIHAADRDQVAAAVQLSISNRTEFALEYRVHHSNGEWRWVWELGCPVVDSHGQVVALEGIIKDITVRKAAELALRESESRTAAIFSALPTGVAFARSRSILEVNAQFCEITGYSRAELMGASTRMLYANEAEFIRAGRVVYGQLKTQRIGRCEAVWKRKDGSLYRVSLSASKFDPKAPARGITFIVTDEGPVSPPAPAE